MATVVCISCVKSKRSHRSRVEDLYTSPLFRKLLAYAKSLDPDRILVLSAKHGVLELDDEVNPYEMTLNRMGVRRTGSTGPTGCSVSSGNVSTWTATSSCSSPASGTAST